MGSKRAFEQGFLPLYDNYRRPSHQTGLNMTMLASKELSEEATQLALKRS